MSIEQPPPPPPLWASAPPSTPQSSGPRTARWMLFSLLGAGLTIVGLLAVVIVLLTSDDESGAGLAKGTAKSTPGASSEDAGPKTFNIVGDITLIDSGVNHTASECWGTGGYDDMVGGAQVVVKDASGTSVAVSQLNAGAPETSVACRFDFVVKGVPAGGSVYSLEVSHRGSYSFTQDEAQTLHLSLG